MGGLEPAPPQRLMAQRPRGGCASRVTGDDSLITQTRARASSAEEPRARAHVWCRKQRTHQVRAHGALRQHERAFRHQEDLNVGKTRGLLLAVILLRVVGAAPLRADLAFNLHPSAQGPQGPGGVKQDGSGPGWNIWFRRERAELRRKTVTLQPRARRWWCLRRGPSRSAAGLAAQRARASGSDGDALHAAWFRDAAWLLPPANLIMSSSHSQLLFLSFNVMLLHPRRLSVHSSEPRAFRTPTNKPI